MLVSRGCNKALPLFFIWCGFSIPIHQVGVLALAENAIGSKAYKPMDIIQSRKGTMVEIGNTDAEGRLALADGELMEFW